MCFCLTPWLSPGRTTKYRAGTVELPVYILHEMVLPGRRLNPAAPRTYQRGTPASVSQAPNRPNHDRREPPGPGRDNDLSQERSPNISSHVTILYSNNGRLLDRPSRCMPIQQVLIRAENQMHVKAKWTLGCHEHLILCRYASTAPYLQFCTVLCDYCLFVRLCYLGLQFATAPFFGLPSHLRHRLGYLGLRRLT